MSLDKASDYFSQLALTNGFRKLEVTVHTVPQLSGINLKLLYVTGIPKARSDSLFQMLTNSNN